MRILKTLLMVISYLILVAFCLFVGAFVTAFLLFLSGRGGADAYELLVILGGVIGAVLGGLIAWGDYRRKYKVWTIIGTIVGILLIFPMLFERRQTCPEVSE